MRLVVISPVRDEAAHLERVVDGMRAQTRPPDEWIVVDDGSSDGGAEIVRAAALPYARVIDAPQRPPARDRLATAAEAAAFNHGLAHAEPGWDFVAKLDGDVELSPRHYERLLAEFEAEPRLGIAGCYLEADGRLQEQPAYHVNGALKLYRRECFEEIERRQGAAGMLERLGWDTIDETYARMAGWRTRSFRDLRARHLKPSGSVGGLVRGRARHGECIWICHYPAWLALARGARLALRPPYVVGGLAFVWGYVRGALARRPRIGDRDFRRFVRRELRTRAARAIRRA